MLATLGVAIFGSVLGGLAGFFGGVWDSILSRLTDIFFAIPVVLGGLVLLSVVTSNTVWPVIGFMVLLGWPQISRIARGSVITAKQNDYVQAARALGASNSRLLLRHITPNAVAPVIVVATIALGTYISLEATLSYLGVGLKPPRSAGASTSRQPPSTSATPPTCSSGPPAPGHHRPRVHHARRRGTRRPRPEAEVTERWRFKCGVSEGSRGAGRPPRASDTGRAAGGRSRHRCPSCEAGSGTRRGHCAGPATRPTDMRSTTGTRTPSLPDGAEPG